jgi:biopolymer transport protein ExbB/TolQ
MASFLKKYPKSFALKSVGLAIIILFVTACYEFVIRPSADAAFEEGRAISAESGQTPFSIWIVLKDYEQQVCFVLCFWGLFLLGLKIKDSIAENNALEVDYLGLGEEDRLKKEDARPLLWKLERGKEGHNKSLYYRALYRTIEFFRFATSLEEITNIVKNTCEGELLRQDSEMSMIRYIAWAIPSIGFVGTVRGIGDALGKAQAALEGDISAVTASLGTAFNSTLVALLLSLVLMFVVYQVQRMQEQLVMDVENYIQDNVVSKLYIG